MLVEQTLFNYYSTNISLEEKTRIIKDWTSLYDFEKFNERHQLKQINNIKYSSNIVKDIIDNNLHYGIETYILKKYMSTFIHNGEFNYLYEKLNLDTDQIKHAILYACLDLALGRLHYYDNRTEQLLDMKFYSEVGSIDDGFADANIEKMREEIILATKDLDYYVIVFALYYNEYVSFKDVVMMVLDDLMLASGDTTITLFEVLVNYMDILEDKHKIDLAEWGVLDDPR